MGRTSRMIGREVCQAALCAGLLFAAGCQELFHPKPDETLQANETTGTDRAYTVTFNRNNGADNDRYTARTVTPPAETIAEADFPQDPAWNGYGFAGWNTASDGEGSSFTASIPVTDDITVYAQWAPQLPGNLSLDESLTWISGNAVGGAEYIIIVKQDETLAPKTLFYSGKNVSITLKGDTVERKVSLSSNGILFAVGSLVTLTLGDNITLQGSNNNTASLVMVSTGGELIMNAGSKISGNTASSYGSGVYVSGGGVFTMNGGTISGNTASSGGGGVDVSGGGAFTMNGGTISGNRAFLGGGVYVYDGTFTMNGGTIRGNTSSYGGGVYVSGNGVFAMSGGTISNNTASSGGGVHVYGIFTMSGGTISNNTASSSGGGVYVYDGTFTMNGGTISNNTASYGGGGVYVWGGAFTKQSGGTIYGSDDVLKNTSTLSGGHAVYVSGGKKRNSTAGVGVTLDSSKDGAEGGWE